MSRLMVRLRSPREPRPTKTIYEIASSLRHGVFLLCPEPPPRDSGLSPVRSPQENGFLLFYRNSDRTLLRRLPRTQHCGNGRCTASSRPPTTSNFLDFLGLLWHVFLTAALLSKERISHPNSIRVRAECRCFLFRFQLKAGHAPYRFSAARRLRVGIEVYRENENGLLVEAYSGNTLGHPSTQQQVRT